MSLSNNELTNYDDLAVELLRIFAQGNNVRSIISATNILSDSHFILNYLLDKKSATIGEVCSVMGVSFEKINEPIKILIEQKCINIIGFLKISDNTEITITETGKNALSKLHTDILNASSLVLEQLGEDSARELVQLVYQISVISKELFKDGKPKADSIKELTE